MLQRDISLVSPNADARSFTYPIDTLVLHYTGMQTAEDAIARLCDRNAKVSAHYVVDEDGLIFQLVPEEDRAWHAGVSHWRGRDGINDASIGVEIVNPGHEFGYRPFTEIQMQRVVELCQDILEHHAIPARNVVAHSDIAPERKEDPGEYFDWQRLADAGVGLWPGAYQPHLRQHILLSPWDSGEEVEHLQQRLQDYGYGIDITGEYDPLTAKVVVAFQRHFRPVHLDECWDAECDARLEELLRMAGDVF